MLKELKFELSDKKVKPLFSTITNNNKIIMCLFDTGANMPVWCKTKDLFDITFPDAELYDKPVTLNGFGKMPEDVSVYRIPIFSMSDGIHKIEFRNLLVAGAFKRNYDCSLILSYTMFSHVNYSVINIGIDIPVLDIKYGRDIYYVVSVMGRKVNKLNRISVFASEDMDNCGLVESMIAFD